ncbi:MAG: RelA/SpoT family protein, partial [Burkholderiales bacterium]
GEPADQHALATGLIVADLGLGPETVAAAIAIPAAGVPEAELAVALDTEAARLAAGAARMRTIESLSGRAHARLEADARARELENLRKMLLAMVEDPRVVLIKLADHTQTLRAVVKSADAPARTAAAQLALDLFAPLANRLGVWQLKWELEDLAFRVLEPEVYKGLARRLDEKRGDRERYIAQLIAALEAELVGNGIQADVSGRPKHIHSIWKKMQRKGVDFEALHDVRAVRVLVEDVKDCYATLGLVHHLWTPIPGEFDDYIAKPKTNDYRSLHTAVIGPEGKAVEVQIRTHEMHQASELGVAAHWRYKEGAPRAGGRRGADERIAWLRQVLDWRHDVADAGELAGEFRSRLLDDTIYVLTPEGQVIDLPMGATPVDFAYHVHSGLGHRCRGAKVDGVMVPLNTPLKNGQQVEILAARTGGPSRDWLNASLGYLQSPSARSRVRQWFNRQNLEHAIAQGRAVVEKELARRGATAMPLDRLARALDYAKTDAFLADVGRGKLGPRALELAIEPPAEATPVKEAPRALRRTPKPAGGSGILVVGVDKLMTLTARCCKPAPPDAIVGFVTRGRGVTIHRASCANLARLDRVRLMPAAWGARAAGVAFPADIEVEAADRTGLLRDITETFTRERINVTATNTASRDQRARMRFTIEIADRAQLRRVLVEIRRVRGVERAAQRKSS